MAITVVLGATMTRTILTLLMLLLAPPAAHAQGILVKLCEKANALSKDKDGKDVKKEVNICLIHHEHLEKGNVLVSAALRHIEGQDKQHFMVMVPLGKLIKPGMHVMIYPMGLWENVKTNEGVSESDQPGLQSLSLSYTLCHPAGCTAEVEATPELLTSLKSGGGVKVLATSESGASGAFSIPLNGFAQALEGEPFDPRKPRTPTTPMWCDQGSWRGCALP